MRGMMTGLFAAALVSTSAFAQTDFTEYLKAYESDEAEKKEAIAEDYSFDEPTDVFAGTSWYIQGFGSFGITNKSELTMAGVNVDDDLDMDNAIGAGTAIGLRKDRWRTEFEASVQRYGFSFRNGVNGMDADITNYNFFVNLYYDMPLQEKLDLYLGGGAGVSIFRGDFDVSSIAGDTNDVTHDVVFGYHFDAGLSYQLTPKVQTFTGYRLMSSLDPEFDGIELESPVIHTIMAGLRYNF